MSPKSYFTVNKKYKSNILKKIKPINYFINNPSELQEYNGRGVKICIIDSGYPHHKDIKKSFNTISFCDDDTSVFDNMGHSTMISGIISANNKKSIIGVAPGSQLLYAKVVGNNGKCSFNSIVAAILWAIVKKVDIISISLGVNYDYSILHDAIKKAVKNNILIIGASGKTSIQTFPSDYNEVFSIKNIKRTKKQKISRITDFNPNKLVYTTYLDNSYIKSRGTSISTAYFTGLASLLMEKYKKSIPIHEIPPLIESRLNKLIR